MEHFQHRKMTCRKTREGPFIRVLIGERVISNLNLSYFKDTGEGIVYLEGGETLTQTAQRSCGSMEVLKARFSGALGNWI